MNDVWSVLNSIQVLVGAAFGLGVCAAAMTLGVALVARTMKWAPVTITVNVTGAAQADPAMPALIEALEKVANLREFTMEEIRDTPPEATTEAFVADRALASIKRTPA